jgi:hypothetical protein
MSGPSSNCDLSTAKRGIIGSRSVFELRKTSRLSGGKEEEGAQSAATRRFDYRIVTHCLVAQPAEMALDISIFIAAKEPLLRLHSSISGAVESDLTLLLIAHAWHAMMHMPFHLRAHARSRA